MAYFTVVCLTSDSGLKKFDFRDLPQQTLMEMLISDIRHSELVCGDYENPRDITKWNSVRCNDNGEVLEVNWSFRLISYDSTIDLRCIPATVKVFDISGNQLSGTLCLNKLPESLQTVWFRENRFSGTVNLTALPCCLERLSLSGNNLTGSLDLTQLVPSIQELSLSKNGFTGTLNLESLPQSFRMLDVSRNKLSGSPIFKNLPEKLDELQLSFNQFSAPIDLTSLPASVEDLVLSDNSIDGNIVIKASMTTRLYIDGNANANIVREDGEEVNLSNIYS